MFCITIKPHSRIGIAACWNSELRVRSRLAPLLFTPFLLWFGSQLGLPTISRESGQKSTISRGISRQILEKISRQIISCFKHEKFPREQVQLLCQQVVVESVPSALAMWNSFNNNGNFRLIWRNKHNLIIFVYNPWLWLSFEINNN